MLEAAVADLDWTSRGRLAWLLALGVLDPAPDAALDAIVALVARVTGSPAGVCLEGEGGPVPVAAAGDPPPPPGGDGAPIVVAGLRVGEVRGTDPDGSSLAAAAASVADVLAERAERLRTDEHGRPVAVVLLDGSGDLLWASAEFESLLGWPVAAWLGRSALALLAADSAEASASIFVRTVASPGRGGNLSHPLTLASGEVVPIVIQSHNLLGDERVGAVALVLRAPPPPESENAVLADQIWVLNRLSAGVPLADVLARVVEMAERHDPRSHACIMRIEDGGSRLSPVSAPHVVPAAVAALRGLPVGPASPAGGATVHFGLPRFTSHLPPGGDGAVGAELARSGYQACWSLPIPAMETDAQLGSLDVYRTVRGMPSDEDTRVLLLAARLTAIAFEHESKTRRLRLQATHDPLTGLANRVLFAERLADVSCATAGVLFIDLDRFKLVNDTLGHTFGDEVLRAVAARLAEEVEEPAVVARFGGDEFTILMPDVGSLEAVVAAGERLLGRLSEPYAVRDRTVTIGASAGAAFAREPGRAGESLVRDADTALYHAKEQGRGRVEAFDTRLLAALATRVEVERVLRDALATGGLTAHFQPEVRVGSGRVVAAEALARCRGSGGEVVGPSVFIPVAEEVGLISRVFEVVLDAACRAAVEWNRQREDPLVVWVNLAPQQLGSAGLVDQVSRAIAAAGAAPGWIGFEVTERGILPDPTEAARRLRELATLGVRLAVDDFGTGHSSLGYLQNLPVDTVKLDRSFVTGAVDDLRSRAIVRAVVGLATAIGLSCVAEGVETPEQLAVIRELGCELAQGYVYRHPTPAVDLAAWMAEVHHPDRA